MRERAGALGSGYGAGSGERLFRLPRCAMISIRQPTCESPRSSSSSEMLSRFPRRISEIRERDRWVYHAAHEFDQPSVSSTSSLAAWRFSSGIGSAQRCMPHLTPAAPSTRHHFHAHGARQRERRDVLRRAAILHCARRPSLSANRPVPSDEPVLGWGQAGAHPFARAEARARARPTSFSSNAAPARRS